MKKVCWTQEEVERLRDMAARGMCQREAAAKLGVSLNRLKAKACKLSISFRGKSGPKRLADWEKARDLAASGYCMREAARVLGVHYTTAMHIARRLGFTWTPALKMGRPPVKRRSRMKAIMPRVASFPNNRRQKETERIERMLQLAGRCA